MYCYSNCYLVSGVPSLPAGIYILLTIHLICVVFILVAGQNTLVRSQLRYTIEL